MKLLTIFRCILILMGLFLMLPCEATSLGMIAKDMAQPAQYAAKLVQTICTVTGLGMIITAFIKYTEYRRFQHVRFSVIAFLFFTGLALIGLGMLSIH